MADESTTTDNSAAAEEARAKAEARRQRILEKSRQRMGVVSGALPGTEVEDDTKEDAEGEGEATAPSGASRMQAMRRRRFKKSTAAKDTAETKEKDEEKAPEESKETPPVSESIPDAPKEDTAKDTSPVSSETKKKYKGVAKMRREMVKKREQKAAEAKEEESTTVSTIPLVRKPPVPILPILFHFVSVILLFLAGIDIGWNQVVYSDVVIYRELTPRTEGVGLVNRYMSSSFKTNLLDPSKLQETQEFTTEDEFVSTETQEEVYIPNLDPIFQVDFDKLTEGGGLFNIVARGAINIHRLLLQIFYYLPISIFKTLISIPQQLLATPPMLCLISLGVRQTAKLLFGAKLPDPPGDKADSKDVLAMMKQGVISFLTGMFPTVVSIYDVWTHLRSDMYVILCGVFVGLAYTHHIATSDVESVSQGSDEL